MPIFGRSASARPRFRHSVLVQIDDRARRRVVAQRHDMGAALGRPRDAVRPRRAVPQLGIGLLHRLHRDRHAVEIVILAVKGQLVLGQADAGDLECLAELLRAGREIDAVKPDLDRRDAAPDAVQKTPLAHLVEHADFVDQPQRVVERQQIDHRAEFEVLRALRDGGEKDARRRRVAERRVVVLREVIGVEPGAIIGLDQAEPVLEMPGQRQAAVVEMVEDPELHRRLPNHTWFRRIVRGRRTGSKRNRRRHCCGGMRRRAGFDWSSRGSRKVSAPRRRCSHRPGQSRRPPAQGRPELDGSFSNP